MCGIVAYLGKKAAQPILVEGLKRLEYRGYDSAGIAILRNKDIKVIKTSGRINVLEQALDKVDSSDTLGIGHTRWATHGKPNTVNAHPHVDCTGKIALVMEEGRVALITEAKSTIIGYELTSPSE